MVDAIDGRFTQRLHVLFGHAPAERFGFFHVGIVEHCEVRCDVPPLLHENLVPFCDAVQVAHFDVHHVPTDHEHHREDDDDDPAVHGEIFHDDGEVARLHPAQPILLNFRVAVLDEVLRFFAALPVCCEHHPSGWAGDFVDLQLIHFARDSHRAGLRVASDGEVAVQPRHPRAHCRGLLAVEVKRRLCAFAHDCKMRPRIRGELLVLRLRALAADFDEWREAVRAEHEGFVPVATTEDDGRWLCDGDFHPCGNRHRPIVRPQQRGRCRDAESIFPVERNTAADERSFRRSALSVCAVFVLRRIARGCARFAEVKDECRVAVVAPRDIFGLIRLLVVGDEIHPERRLRVRFYVRELHPNERFHERQIELLHVEGERRFVIRRDKAHIAQILLCAGGPIPIKQA